MSRRPPLTGRLLTGLLLAGLVVALTSPARAQDYAAGRDAYDAARFAEAARRWGQAIAKRSPSMGAAELEAWIGQAWYRQGDLDAAELWLLRGRDHGDARVKDVALRRLGRIAQQRGRLETAARDFGAALEGQRARGELDEVLVTRAYLANVEYGRARFHAAWEAYEALLDEARARGDEHREAVALVGLGLVCARIWQTDLADSYLRQAVDLQGRLGLGGDVTRAEIERAMIAVLDHRFDDAEERLAAAEASRGDSEVDARRIGVVRVKLAMARQDPQEAARHLEALVAAQARLFVPMAAIEIALASARRALAIGAPARALEHLAGLTDRDMTAQQRDYHLLLRAQALHGVGDDDAAIDTLERFRDQHDAQREGFGDEALRSYVDADQVSGLQALLEAAAHAGRFDAAVGVLARLKARLYTEKLLRRTPRASEDGPETRVAALTAALDRAWATEGGAAGDAALLDYYVEPDVVWIAWRVDGEQGLTRLDWSEAQLTGQVRALRAAILRRDAGYEELARTLGAALLAPLAGRRSAARPRAVIIVPHGPLHELPFAALRLDGHFAVELFDISYAASSAAAARVSPPHTGPPRALLVADAAGDLPAARQEVERLRARYPGATLLTGASARRDAVLDAMTRADLVHIAVHGRRDRDGLPPHLLLAPGADGPASARLDARHVLARSLDGPVVVLAACESGVARGDAGDELPDLLPRALLLAGARAVVATQWPIDDASAAALMRGFHARLSTLGPRAALAAAQRALLQKAAEPDAVALRGDPGYDRCRGLKPCTGVRQAPLSHPFHWAAFTLIGEAR